MRTVWRSTSTITLAKVRHLKATRAKVCKKWLASAKRASEADSFPMNLQENN
jgi:hypothetical protein